MKNRLAQTTLLLFTASLLFFAGVMQVEAATKMPSFALESVDDGRTVRSNAFDGKVLLITFFATWCPPCAQEVPVLNELHNKYGSEGFSVVALSVDQEGPSAVSKFVKERNIQYPVLMAQAETTADFGGVYGIPVAFLVNKSGNVVKKYTGYVSHKILEKDVNRLLN